MLNFKAMERLEINGKTPLALLTVDEFKSLLNLNEKPLPIESNDFPDVKEYVYGLAGLAKLLNCSKPTAQTLKNSGKITFSQSGRKIIFQKDQVLQELRSKK